LTHSNFAYLKEEFPILFNTGQAAEYNLYQDPITSLFKLRQFGERLTEILFDKHRLEFPHYHWLKAEIDNLLQTILNKAFKGELVPQDENDEPASELLERIKKERRKTDGKGKKKYKVGESVWPMAAEKGGGCE